MRQKPLKQSPLFSNLNSKRSKLLHFFFLFLVLSLSAREKYPERAEIHFPYIEYSLEIPDKGDFVDLLKKGSRSSLTIQLEVWREPIRFLPSSRPDLRITIQKTAAEDLITGEYVIQDDHKGIFFFTDREDFIKAYLKTEIAIPEAYTFPEDFSQVRFRIKSTLIKRLYVEPFHMFLLLDRKNRINGDWITLTPETDEKDD